MVEKLFTAEQRYRDLVEALGDIVFVCGADGELELVNPAWTETLGYSVHEAIGRPIYEFLSDPGDKAELLRILDACNDSPGGAQKLRFRHKSGAVIWLELSVRCGKKGNCVGLLYDTTPGKKVKTAMFDGAELSSDLVSNASHELRTPLAAIIGFASTILNDRNMQYPRFGEGVLEIGKKVDAAAIGEPEIEQDNIGRCLCHVAVHLRAAGDGLTVIAPVPDIVGEESPYIGVIVNNQH